MSTVVELPHWDMSVVYPDLHSEEFERDFQGIIRDVADLGSVFDEHAIGQRSESTVDQATIRTFETVTGRLTALLDCLFTIQMYISSFVATDSRDDLAQARQSELQQHLVRLTQLQTRYTAWIGSLDVEELIAQSQLASELSYYLRRKKIAATHLMGPDEEALAAELHVSAGAAWAKLSTDLTSQISVTLGLDGEVEDRPMSVIRNLAFDPDRETRRRAYEAELAAWEQASIPLAAALNSIKGQSNTLERRRGWDSVLDMALFTTSIDRCTLDVMMDAARAAFPDFRRYLRAKARALGLPILAWYDLFAPVGASERTWKYDEATDFLLEQFGTYSPRLREYAQRAFRENWIDAEPRSGKRDGAFCAYLRGDESRILTNFRPTYDGMSTLAHELGHGYHNFNLARRPILQRTAPMTLAETASIFCETIVREAALKQASTAEQIAILEASLQGDCQVVVDITSRFLFERDVLERRQQRELSVDELNELMLDSQRATYGDGLDTTMLHPYMWAVKGHYYSTARPFYNYPYMFGLLFGLGLYAHYKADPEAFTSGYDDLLSSTGLADAATLAERFGIDIRSTDFWTSSLDMVRADVDAFERLIDGDAQRAQAHEKS